VVTGDHDEIGCGDLRFGEHGLQHRQYAVHVGQNRNLADPHQVSLHAATGQLHRTRPVTCRRAMADRHELRSSAPLA